MAKPTRLFSHKNQEDEYNAARLVEDALWNDSAEDLLKLISPRLAAIIRSYPDDKEVIGRQLIRDRRRKYLEGYAEGKFETKNGK